jgi:hypothetical protein
MNPPTMPQDRARAIAARAAHQRDRRTMVVTPRRPLPLQYDEAGFPITPQSRSFAERVRSLLLG